MQQAGGWMDARQCCQAIHTTRYLSHHSDAPLDASHSQGAHSTCCYLAAQAAWYLKCRALTLKHWLDDTEIEEEVPSGFSAARVGRVLC